MCGVLAGSARFTPRLTLGYRDAVAPAESSLHPAGRRVTGHEFHRTTVEFTEDVQPAWLLPQGGEGAIRAGVHASYLHTHPAAHPDSIRRFVGRAALAGVRLDAG
jgi:cobyrinic acid a,c-diamide synthase